MYLLIYTYVLPIDVFCAHLRYVGTICVGYGFRRCARFFEHDSVYFFTKYISHFYCLLHLTMSYKFDR